MRDPEATEKAGLNEPRTLLALPSKEQWDLCYAEWRKAIEEWKRARDLQSDVQLLKSENAEGLRTDFCRALLGQRTPPARIVELLARLLPEMYDRYSKIWQVPTPKQTSDVSWFVEQFASRYRAEMGGSAEVFVLTSRPLENDSPVLLDAAVKFLADNASNRLTFILSDTYEDWTRWSDTTDMKELPTSNRWRRIDLDCIRNNIESILDRAAAAGSVACRDQLSILSLSFLQLLQADDRATKMRFIDLAASQMFSPSQVWMYCKGVNSRSVAFLYTATGRGAEYYRWLPLADDESRRLGGFVSSLLRLRKDFPFAIENITDRVLSNSLVAGAAEPHVPVTAPL